MKPPCALAASVFLVAALFFSNSHASDQSLDVTFTALGFQDNSTLSDDDLVGSVNLNYYGTYDFDTDTSIGFDGNLDIGIVDARDFRYEISELYLKKAWSSGDLLIGRAYTGWKQDDIYSPTDFISQREFFPGGVLFPQLGHAMARVRYFGDNTTLELAVSEFRQPKFEAIYDFSDNIPPVDEDFAVFDGDETTPELQISARQSWSSELGDFAVVLGYGYESFPVFTPRLNAQTFEVLSLTPNYSSGFKLGLSFSSEIGDTGFLVDFEGALLEHSLEIDLNRLNAGVFRVGLEKEVGTNSILRGSSLNFKGNVFYDTRKELSPVIFNSDVDLAVNWNLGDRNSSRLTVNLLYDYESNEKIVALNLSRTVMSDARITAEFSNSFDSLCNKCAKFNLNLELFF